MFADYFVCMSTINIPMAQFIRKNNRCNFLFIIVMNTLCRKNNTSVL